MLYIYSMLIVDGSQKSGSGTIVRYAVAIGALLNRKVKVINVRAQRKKPGLRPQHLAAIRAVAELTGGSIEGGEVGADEFIFTPENKMSGGTFEWHIGTAGSTTMLVMTVLPLALITRDKIIGKITGGLFQDFAPSFFHMQQVLGPVLWKMGVTMRVNMIRPGYVPEGGGILEIEIDPVKKSLQPLTLTDQGRIETIDGFAFSSHLKDREVSGRMADVCRKVLSKKGFNVNIGEEYENTALQPGAALAVFARTSTHCILGADRAGAPGRRSEAIGRFVARSFIEDIESGATVDRYLADQIILYAALADGITEFRIPFMTDHVETNLWLVEEYLGSKIEIEDNLISITGIGLNSHSS